MKYILLLIILGISSIHGMSEQEKLSLAETLIEEINLENTDKAKNVIFRLKNDPAINMQSKYFYHDTPLHQAAYTGNLELIKLLLDSGATPSKNIKNKKGFLPIDNLINYGEHRAPSKEAYQEMCSLLKTD